MRPSYLAGIGLDVASPSAEARAIAVAAARECLGTRFHFNQRTPGLAIDCVGVVRYSMQRAGLYCPPDKHYSARTSFGRHVYDDCREGMDEIPQDELKAGSVVLLWLARPELPQHLGVWSGSSMIHADTRTRCVIETPGLSVYHKHVFAVFDMRVSNTANHREDYNGNCRTPGRR